MPSLFSFGNHHETKRGHKHTKMVHSYFRMDHRKPSRKKTASTWQSCTMPPGCHHLYINMHHLYVYEYWAIIYMWICHHLYATSICQYVISRLRSETKQHLYVNIRITDYNIYKWKDTTWKYYRKLNWFMAVKH